MNATTTVQQLKDLWADRNPNAVIDRGEDLSPIARDDITALVDAGELDHDDDGTPVETAWEILAAQFNSDLTAAPGAESPALQAVQEAKESRDRDLGLAETIIRDAHEHVRQAVLAALAAREPVTAIAEALGVKRARIYQIRDGRR